MLRRMTALTVVFCILASAVFAYAATPRLNALVDADLMLKISSVGIAECTVDTFTSNRDLTVYVSMRLYQDDDDYAVWEYTDYGLVYETESVAVPQGHEYYAGAYILVTDADGNTIDSDIICTETVVH